MSILHIRDSRTIENPLEIANVNQTGGRRDTESLNLWHRQEDQEAGVITMAHFRQQAKWNGRGLSTRTNSHNTWAHGSFRSHEELQRDDIIEKKLIMKIWKAWCPNLIQMFHHWMTLIDKEIDINILQLQTSRFSHTKSTSRICWVCEKPMYSKLVNKTWECFANC
jgi:hypothetical protein